MLSNMADPLRSQEELIQVKHGDNTWTIDIYQGNKLTLTKLEWDRGFFFFLDYYVTYNIQDMAMFKDGHQPLLVSHWVPIGSMTSSGDLDMHWGAPSHEAYFVTPDNTLLFKMKIKPPPPPVFLLLEFGWDSVYPIWILALVWFLMFRLSVDN